jgi:hypothetical protein
LPVTPRHLKFKLFRIFSTFITLAQRGNKKW